MLKKNNLTITGKTEDDRDVIGNVFKLIDTQGVPMEIVIDFFEKNNMIVDWIVFYEQASKSGWKLKTIKDRIKYPLLDCYGTEYTNTIMERLEEHMRSLDSG